MYVIDLKPGVRFRLFKDKDAAVYTCVEEYQSSGAPIKCIDTKGIIHYFDSGQRVFQIIKLQDLQPGTDVEIVPGTWIKIMDTPVVGCTLKNGDIAMYPGDREVMI